MQEKLSNFLQENILTLMVFDEKAISLLINSLKINYFESSIYREIAKKSISFYNRFKKCIGNHIVDEFESTVQNGDDKATFYKDVLNSLLGNKELINREYVLSELNKFIRRQEIKLGIKKAVEKIEEENIDEAETALIECVKQREISFDTGSFLSDTDSFLSFLDGDDLARNTIKTGISELDRYGICPATGEMYALMALQGVGKSWFLTHLGKMALMQRKKVLHISLEVSEEILKMRYIQSFFKVSKEAYNSYTPGKFKVDSDGFLDRIEGVNMISNYSFDQTNIRDVLTKKIKKLPSKNLNLKQFPDGSLTMKQLRAYIDSLIEYKQFMPDLVILDYPKKMHLDLNKLREHLGRIYIELRGMAKEYNFALAIVAQLNREAKKSKNPWLDESSLQEDFSLANEADYLISANQTEEEYEMGLMRLYNTKSRNDSKNLKVLISQNFHIGQFCMDSALIKDMDFLKNV